MDIYLGAPGAVCPLGNRLSIIFEKMAGGRTGIQKVEDAFGLGRDEFLGIVDDQLITDKEDTKLRSMISTSLAETIEGLADPAILKNERTRVILCTTKGEIDKIENQDLDGAHLFKLAQWLKIRYDLAHAPIVISSACVSGLLGIINAKRMVTQGVADQVLVIGADLVTRFTLSGFISFYATASTPSKPYDKSRDGINLGEAAASVVVSAGNAIFKDTFAKYLGGASANDANHISGPSRTGEGLYRSVNRAMEETKLQPTDLDFISAHGTATAFNDEMEAIAFDRLGMNDIPLNSMKGYFGHTLGAAGLLESIIGIKTLQEQTLVQSLGFANAGVSKRISVLNQNHKGKFKTMLKTSSGFGGSNAAAIFQAL